MIAVIISATAALLVLAALVDLALMHRKIDRLEDALRDIKRRIGLPEA